MTILTLGTVGILLLWWMANPSPLIPKPWDVVRAFGTLWTQEGLGVELYTSFKLCMVSLTVSTFIVLLFSYSTLWGAMRPFVRFLTKLRFLGITGLLFVFTRVSNSGFELKVYLMCFTIITFYLTSMSAVVQNIPQSKFEYGETLRMSQWQVIWEVVVLGTLADAIDVLKQNAAIGYMMITSIEALSRAQGGVGALMLNQDKHFNLDAVFAIQGCILIIGLGLDYFLGVLKNLICPQAALVTGKK